jgi:hypothetical protein
MPAVLLDAYTDWFCPACGKEDRTRPVPPNSARFHPCPSLHDLSAPLVRAGSDCKLVANERQEYLGREIQATGDDGRPYMSVYTVYADGRNDCVVNAPVARAILSTD